MLVFWDAEVSETTHQVLDLGAVKGKSTFHSPSLPDFMAFIRDAQFLVAHNLFAHDLRYIRADLDREGLRPALIDTLYLSPLLFPGKPSHRLSKDDKPDSTLLSLLASFESLNPHLYLSDLVQFLRESSLEDDLTGPDEKGSITVCTLHKAKGREFDQAFLVLSRRPADDADRRALYVGLTRARHEVRIFQHENAMDAVFPELERQTDPCHYPSYPQTVLSLGFRDVFLSGFSARTDLVASCHSGAPLTLHFPFLLRADGVRLLCLSKSAQDRVRELTNKSYVFTRGYVRAIVAWQGAEDEKESWMVLPTLVFRRPSPD